MLRSTLGEHLQGASNESQIVIHYTFAINKPSLEQEKDNEEWIRVVSVEQVFEDEEEGALCATGLFSGVINVFDGEFNQIASKEVYDGMVNDLKITRIENQRVIISGAQDINFHTLNNKNQLLHSARIEE